MSSEISRKTSMETRIMIDVETIWDYVLAIVLATAGGLARLLQKKDETKLQLSRIFAELFISGFAGLMVLLLARASGLTGDWLGLVCGMAGWVGPKILDIITRPMAKALGLDINAEKKTINEDVDMSK